MPSDETSVKEYCIFDTMDMFQAKRTRSWTFDKYLLMPSDVISAILESIFDQLNIFLAYWYSILNIQYILIDSFWCYFRRVWTHCWPTEKISGILVHDDEISIQTDWLLLVLYQTVSSPYLTLGTYFWPKSTWSWTFYRYSLTPDDTSAIEYCIFDPVDIFLAK